MTAVLMAVGTALVSSRAACRPRFGRARCRAEALQVTADSTTSGSQPDDSAAGGWAAQLRLRLTRRKVVLAEELRGVRDAAEAAAQRSAQLEAELRKGMDQERSVNDALRDELMKVRKFYNKLNDELEATQVESAFREKDLTADLSEAQRDLQESKRREAALQERMLEMEAEEERLTQELLGTVQELARAQERGEDLKDQISNWEEMASGLMAEVDQKDAQVTELAELSQQVQGKLEESQEENQKLRSKLSAVQQKQREGEAEFQAQVAQIQEENTQLKDALRAAQQDVEKLLQPMEP